MRLKTDGQREFDFANTIQSLEEDAQVAQEALREAHWKLPAIPFVTRWSKILLIQKLVFKNYPFASKVNRLGQQK